MLLSILVGAIVTLGGLGEVNVHHSPQELEPIRLVASSHQVDFPVQVTFSMQAEADTQISEVTLFYRAGRDNARTYGYPSFTPATRVNADFSIKTDGANYLPSGTDIEYFYSIRDKNGNVFETETFWVEYKDPSFEWQRLELQDLTILWHDRPRSRVDLVGAEVEMRLIEVKRLLGLEDMRPMNAVIVNTAREAARSFPFVSGAASKGHVYGGFAFGQYDVFVLAGLTTDGIMHEMTHLLVDEALGYARARVPSWLNEGLAMYFESGSRGREKTVTGAARAERLSPLRSMGKVPGRPGDVRLFYAQSWSFVKQLMDVYGADRMSVLLDSLKGGKRIDKALPPAYRVPPDGPERNWKAEVRRGSSVTRVDPGSLGTSVIIGGAGAVAIVAAIMRWFRHATTASNSERGRRSCGPRLPRGPVLGPRPPSC